MTLLTLTQQNSFKPISQNWAASAKLTGGVDNFTQLATEVENKELKSLLGIALLQDVQVRPTVAPNDDLLDGADFEDCNGNTISHKGLRFILAYLNWSKYVSESFVSDTYTGMVKKNRNEAESLTSGDIKRLQQDAREIALQEFELVKDYLNENTDSFPLWIASSSKKPYVPKFKGVKRTIL